MNDVVASVDQDWLHLEVACRDNDRPGAQDLKRLLTLNYSLPFARFALRERKLLVLADVPIEQARSPLLRAALNALKVAQVCCLDPSTVQAKAEEGCVLKPSRQSGERIDQREIFHMIRDALQVDRLKIAKAPENHKAGECSFTCFDFRLGSLQPLEIKAEASEVIFQSAVPTLDPDSTASNKNDSIELALAVWMLSANAETVFAKMAYFAGDPLVMVRWPLVHLSEVECRKAVDIVPQFAASVSGEIESLSRWEVAEEYLWRRGWHRRKHLHQVERR